MCEKLPKGWDMMPLSSVTEFIKDGTHGTHKDVVNGIPLLSAKDIYNGVVNIPDDCRRISLQDYQAIHSNFTLQQNDILLTIVGTIGRLAKLKGTEPTFTVQRSVAIIRLLFPEYAGFFYHYFSSVKFYRQLINSMNASAQGGVYLGALEKIDTICPTEPEIIAITLILDSIDSLIFQTETKIDKLSKIKSGLMQDLLTKGIDENGRIRDPKRHPEQFEKGIPTFWDYRDLPQLCTLINGRAFKPSEWSNQGLPIVRIENLNDFEAPFNYCNFKVDEKYYIDSGDLLISWSGTPGTSFGIFFWNRGKAVLNQHIFKAIVNEELVTKKYFYYSYLNVLDFMISKSHGGAGLKHITKKDLEKMRIAIPLNPNEQQNITNILMKQDEHLVNEKIYSSKLKLLKQGLMQDLLTGRKRIPKEMIKEEVSL